MPMGSAYLRCHRSVAAGYRPRGMRIPATARHLEMSDIRPGTTLCWWPTPVSPTLSICDRGGNCCWQPQRDAGCTEAALAGFLER